ncbi:hypothetical protein WEI85_19915 [Actinomycetes bacterium KLBMP 9797]
MTAPRKPSGNMPPQIRGPFGLLGYIVFRLFNILDGVFADSQKTWGGTLRAIATLFAFAIPVALLVPDTYSFVRKPAGSAWQQAVDFALKYPNVAAAIASIAIVTMALKSWHNRRVNARAAATEQNTKQNKDAAKGAP